MDQPVQTEPHIIEILPPSLRHETASVVRLAVAIVALVSLYIAGTAWTSSNSIRVGDLLPYQVLMADRPSTEQRMFSELQEGLLEAQRIRSMTGGWPSPAALADQGIPPFATDPTHATPYVWTVTARGVFVNYRGTPRVTGAPAWLLLIQEPDAGAAPDRAAEDEEHHRLSDGAMLHVSVWSHADGADLPARMVSLPQVEGWTQLRAGPPNVSALHGAGNEAEPLGSLAALFAGVRLEAQSRQPIVKIGVTLHPYYSWTMNVVGQLPGYEVRPILPGEIDAGDYQPRPEDIKKLIDLDAIVVNGIGHDDFIFPMIKASGNRKIAIIRPNDETPQIHQVHGSAVNSHTFISFTNAIQQTYAIARAIAALRPEDAAALQQNAADYARRLRIIKAAAATKLAEAKITRVVTVHDGYGYLLQEFGLEVAGVVQPAHGLMPSAAELKEMVALLKREHITVVFSEATFPPALLKVLQDEAGVKVYTITHIASGPFTADKFEREMQANVDTMIRALVTKG